MQAAIITAYQTSHSLVRGEVDTSGLMLLKQLEEWLISEIAAGRLVQVLDKPWPARFAYYLVTLPDTTQRAEGRAFRDWISEQAQL